MAPKKDVKEEKDDSEYTYLTEEEEEEPEPLPPTKAPAPVSPNEKAAVAAVRVYEARAAKDGASSSDDRGPRARGAASPSPARRARPHRSPEVEPRRSRVPDRRDHRETAPFPSLPTPAPGCHRHLLRSLHGGIGRPSVVSSGARIAGRMVGSGGSTSGMSQHMYWNELCLAWQCYGDGTRCSWDEAVGRAHEVKRAREREEYAELGEEVMPARSRQQRQAKEEAKEKVRSGHEGLPREETEQRQEQTMRMIHAITRRRRRRCVGAVQKFHGNSTRRGRRGVAESTRSIVTAAAPHHLMFVPDPRVPRSRRRTMKMIETRVRLSTGPLRTKYGSKCHVLP